MKRVLSALAALSVMSMNFVTAADVVSIDSILIMQKSKEGQEISSKIQKEVEKFQKEVEGYQKELVAMQDSITKQAKALSKEALQEKTEQLANKKKDIERKLTDKEEALKAEIQKKQFMLREKQLATISEVSSKEQWGVLVDRNTPGVLYVSNAIDKTDMVLKAVDEKYLAAANKDTTKTVVAAKTTPATTAESTVTTDAKKTVKVA